MYNRLLPCVSLPGHRTFLLAVGLAHGLLAFSPRTNADLAADYSSLTMGLTSLPGSGGTPGTVLAHGRHAFPLFSPANGRPAVAAAGYFGDATNGARGLAYAHTGWTSTSGAMGTALENAVRWAGRKPLPVVGIGPSVGAKAFLQSLGFTVKDVSTSMSSSSSDLSGVEVFLMNMHSGYTAGALAATTNFLAQGGGLLLFATPWALSSGAFQEANHILLGLGLTYTGAYSSGGELTVPAPPWSPRFSALNAIDALLADHAGDITLSAAEKQIAAQSIQDVLAARPDLAELNTGLQILSDAYGWIRIDSRYALNTDSQPVEAMLEVFQANQLATLPAGQLPAHPDAADWPGLPAADGPVLSKTVFVNGNAPPDDPALINQGGHGLRLPLGLYALPGRVVRVTIPADLVDAGLRIQTGVHQDNNTSSRDTWRRHPRVVRYDPLTRITNEVGCAFGGLLFLRVPPGSVLGSFPITIDGAVEAPHFIYGVHTATDWNRRLRQAPGAWGYVQSSNMTVYVSRRQLATLADPVRPAEHWARAIATADDIMGYLLRYREEAALTDRQISVGYGHAGYPVMMEYGDSDNLINTAVLQGDWGFYHELGHTYQDDGHGWNGTSGGEVDVNLLPHLLMTLVHGRSIWDNNIHSTMDADHRINARNQFFANPPENRLWSDISGSDTAAYDCYFNLPESFGFDLWRRAFSRFYRWSTNQSSEPSFAGLDKYNRWFVAMCEESGRNLGPYFNNYGWPIDSAVEARFAGLPVWTSNQPPVSLSHPGVLNVDEDTPPGTILHTFTTTDPDPGNLFVYDLLSGNEDGAFSLDRWTGQLQVVALDYERKSNYILRVTVFDNAIPRYFLTNLFLVKVGNVLEPPQLVSPLLLASSTMPPGTALGSVGAAVEPGLALEETMAIVGGNDDGVFQIDPATGILTLLRPALLPDPGLITLTVQARDSAAQTAQTPVQVLCNATGGVREERWDNSAREGAPTYTGSLSSFAAPAFGDNYARRLSGFLIPPQTGWYTFWISGNDDAQLFLSDNTLPSGMTLLGSASHTSANGWDEQASQKSAPVLLRGGEACYIEAVQVEGSGSDHVEAAWQGPGIPRQIIPGSVLIPVSSEFLPSTAGTGPVEGIQLRLGSNPIEEPGLYVAPVDFILNADITGDAGSVTRVDFYANGQSLGQDDTFPFRAAWPSVAAGSYLFAAVALDKEGNQFASPSRVIHVYQSTSLSTQIPANALWRYQDQGQDLGVAWRHPEYDDTAWSSGSARLGFGGDGETTVIYGGPSTARHPTTYFRHATVINNLSRYIGFELAVQRDDGAVVYLNGQEVFRSNMPEGVVAYGTLAPNAADEQSFFGVALPPSVFCEGTNILAVEVHQSSATSSDLGFALTLQGTTAVPALAVVLTEPAPGSTLPQPARLKIVAQASTPFSVVTNLILQANGIPIGQIPGASGSFEWPDPPLGTHTLLAVAQTALGPSASSTPIQVSLVSNAVPTVSIANPRDGTQLPAPPSTLLVEAAAEDNDGVASVALLVDGQFLGQLTSPPYTFLYHQPPAGRHILQAEATDAHGLRAASAPITIDITAAPVTTNATLIAADAVWKYHDDGVSLGVIWKHPLLDDGDWTSGPAKLGFGGDGESTVLRGQPVVTYYFRKTFTLPTNFVPTVLTAHLIRDDGAVVYLNGTELFRNNMPAGPVDYATRPLSSIGGTDENAWLATPVDPAVLRPGDNLVAVEIHQVNSTSSDIGFNFEFTAIGTLEPETPPPPILQFERLAPNGFHLWFTSLEGRRFIIERSFDLQNWETVLTNAVVDGRLDFSEELQTSGGSFYRARHAP